MTNVQGRKSARPDGTVVQREGEEKRWGEVGGVVVVQEIVLSQARLGVAMGVK